MGILSKEQIRELIKEKNIKTTEDIDSVLKDMFADIIEETLEAELDTELGYPKNGNLPEGTANRRNGHSSKTVRSEQFRACNRKEAPKRNQRDRGANPCSVC